mgnify:CR=1 FL=1
MSISVKNLTKIFDAQTAVNNISFEAAKGTVTGFLGPNGAGKSTTMKILTTYIQPTSGTALVCGFDVTEQPMEIRKRIGYMPENNPLYYDMYVREFLLFAAGVHRLGKNAASRVDEVIAMTGLTKEVKKKIGALSKGYKQRVGLAQAMIHDPEVLILDEPTSGLDPNQLMDIRKLIQDIGKEKTVLLSTHIMQEVQAMCNRAVIINNGKIVADDQIEQLKNTERNAATILQVQFDKPVKRDQLAVLKHISGLQQTPEGFWLIEATQADAIRRELMTWALSADVTIVQMQTAGESLEEVFRRLTQQHTL